MAEVMEEPSAGVGKTSDEEYFSSYEDVEIHRLMVSDVTRTQAYADAVTKNKHLFQGKVAMDVGAGTGILSLFMAAAGARKVYAVEASGIAALVEKVARDNGFGDIIKVFHDKVENVTLPDDEKVDIIVSEWMGFYLLHESMLNSVLWARDQFLAEDGTVFPSEARIYACPCSLQPLYKEQINVWDNVYGFNMSAVKSYALKSKMTKPEVTIVSESDLLAEPTCVKKLNLRWMTEDEIQFFATSTFVGVTKPGAYQGLCLWFECDFDGREYNEEGEEYGTVVTLSTSPANTPTHWKQTVVVFGYGTEHSSQQLEMASEENIQESTIQKETNIDPSDCTRNNEKITVSVKDSKLKSAQESQDGTQVSNKINCNVIQPSFDNTVEKDEVVGWKLVFSQSSDNTRHYTMTVEMLDPEVEEHPMPCSCPMPRCLIIAKMLEQEMEENDIIDCT